jgi:hypothetical protein
MMALESKPKRHAHYHSYLVRIWRDGNGTPWRASLQDAATGERRGFPDLPSLFAYLQAQTGEADQQRRAYRLGTRTEARVVETNGREFLSWL